eukprot:3395948-Alexandrium_andersonii.AAC.1
MRRAPWTSVSTPAPSKCQVTRLRRPPHPHARTSSGTAVASARVASRHPSGGAGPPVPWDREPMV